MMKAFARTKGSIGPGEQAGEEECMCRSDAIAGGKRKKASACSPPIIGYTRLKPLTSWTSDTPDQTHTTILEYLTRCQGG
jgi:hypothetical protein